MEEEKKKELQRKERAKQMQEELKISNEELLKI
jgi:hypothetical protein